MKPTNPIIAKFICLVRRHHWSYPDHLSVGVKTCLRCGKTERLGKLR